MAETSDTPVGRARRLPRLASRPHRRLALGDGAAGMAAIAGNLRGIAGIFTIRAAVLSVVIHHAITCRMGALLNFVRHDRFSPRTYQGN